jgi:peptidoglycan/xylan/chitin deacetylase (PgdA/CDA1 family)
MTSRVRRRGVSTRVLGFACAAIVLGLVALLLLPGGHANVYGLVSVNGRVLAIPVSATVDSVASGTLALARSGSKLDITGDVTTLAGGTAVTTQVDSRPASPGTTLTDGALVLVEHGDHLLEGIIEKTESIPFETSVTGKGVVVTLAQAGKAGRRTVFLGDASKKQAAVFVITPAQDALIQRTTSTKAGQKLVALTFDDGPGKWTQGVLDALASKNAPATFFMLGSSAAGNKALVQKIKAAGHEVENHSWNHPILTNLTADEVRSQISRTAAIIGGGHFLRPPYGTYNAAVASVAGSMGYRLVLWTVDTLDWKYKDVGSILSYVKAQTKPGGIILMHDGGTADRSQTIAAIPEVVDWLLQNGYSLTTVENLL